MNNVYKYTVKYQPDKKHRQMNHIFTFEPNISRGEILSNTTDA